MLPITPAISIQQSITEQLNKKCNQNAILKGKSLKTLENKGFEALLQLFKLYRSWRFARQIVEYSVYAFDFVDNSVHNFIKDFVW